MFDLIIPCLHRCLTAALSFKDSVVTIQSLVYAELYRRVKLGCCDPISIAAEEILCFGRKNSCFFVLNIPGKWSWVLR